MSDQNSSDAGNVGQPAVAQLRVLTQYVKDVSFENPNAPQALGPVDEQPNISVRVDVGVNRMSDTDYEVALKLGAEARTKDKTMFLVEIDYAGLFRLTNIPEENLEAVLVIECPRQIFPLRAADRRRPDARRRLSAADDRPDRFRQPLSAAPPADGAGAGGRRAA